MRKRGRFLASIALFAAVPLMGEPSVAQDQCGRACLCSQSCCGQKSCDGSVCRTCIAECANGASPSDARYGLLQARCKMLSTQKLERLQRK
jgi:hypothetical protein